MAILAGGLATRLRPLSEQIPKSLIEVGGRPFAEHQVEVLLRRGVTDLVWCVGYLGEQIRDVLGNGERWGVRIRYSFDGPQLLGTGGALRNALPLLGKAFLVMYGDSYLECGYEAAERTFLSSGRLGLMTVLRNDDAWDRSNIVYTQGRIARYDKHRPAPGMRHIDYGLGALQARAFDKYPAGQPLDLATVYEDLLAADELAGLEVTQRFYEIGSPEGLAETRQYFSSTPVQQRDR
jgi:NDP-sugar pyrophosphorylase family protein